MRDAYGSRSEAGVQLTSLLAARSGAPRDRQRGARRFTRAGLNSLTRRSGFRLRAPRVFDVLVGQLVGRGGPAGEEVEGVFGAAAGFGGEDRQP
jgi:hypothetical protein